MKGKAAMLALGLVLVPLSLGPAAARAKKEGPPRPDRPRVVKPEPRAERTAPGAVRAERARARAPGLRNRIRRRLLLARRFGRAPEGARYLRRLRAFRGPVASRRLRARIERFRGARPEAARKIRAWIGKHRPELAKRWRARKERRDGAAAGHRHERTGRPGRKPAAAGSKKGEPSALGRRVEGLEKRLKALERRIEALGRPRKKS